MDASQQSLKEQLQFGLGDRLAKSLHIAGLTSQDMAEVLEVSRNTISNYINGNTRPRKLYLREWAVKTGVPLEWIETGVFPDGPETEKAPARRASGGHGPLYLVEPPTRIELVTYALQGDRMAEIIPLHAA